MSSFDSGFEVAAEAYNKYIVPKNELDYEFDDDAIGVTIGKIERMRDNVR